MTSALNWLGYWLIEASDWIYIPLVSRWLYRIGNRLETME